MQIRISDYLDASEANGPGKRLVIWMQGCLTKCPGCINPHTHDVNGGKLVDSDLLYTKMQESKLNENITGITLTGGEPLLACNLAYTKLLIEHARVLQLDICLFTGYSWYKWSSEQQKIADLCDIVVHGKFIKELMVEDTPLSSSTNQKIIFNTDKYCEDDFLDIPRVEFIINDDGSMMVTGFPSTLI